jgi:hypothetical protein
LHFVYRDGSSDQFVCSIVEPVHFVPLVAGELVHN